MTARRRADLAAAGVLLLLRLHVVRRHGRPPHGHRPPDGRSRGPEPRRGRLPGRAGRARPGPAGGRLEFRLEDDRVTVTGTETVDFTPDLPVDELVFRLVPNGPDSAPAGNRLAVDAVRGDDVRARAGTRTPARPTPGGLYVVDLEDELAAGGVDRGGAGLHPVARRAAASTGSAPTTASPGGPAARRCWRGSRASAGPEDPFVELSRGDGDQPGRRHDRHGVRAGGPHRPHDRDAGRAVGAAATAAGPGPRPSRWPGTSASRRGSSPPPRDDAERRPRDGRRAAGAELAADEVLDGTRGRRSPLSSSTSGPFPYETLTIALLPDYGGGIEYPGLDPAGRRRAAGARARGRAHVVLRDGRQLAVPRPVAGRGVRHLGGVRRRRGRRPRRRGRAGAARGEVGGAMDRLPGRAHVLPRSSTARAAPRCSPPARRPGPRRSTPRSAATSTPPRGDRHARGPRPRWPTCPRPSPSSRTAGALDKDDVPR